jgi:serine/threonine-protein kinase RsbW
MPEPGAIHLTLPARAQHLATARSVAAAAAVTAGLSVTQIEDVRLIVDEAFSAALVGAPEHASVTCVFTPDEVGLHVRVTAPSPSGSVPDPQGFGWLVLSALAVDLSAAVSDGVMTVGLSVPRTVDA